MSVVCECGHDCKDHDDKGCNCWIKHKDNCKKRLCECVLPATLVEALYWARQFKEERDALRITSTELQKALENCLEWMKSIIDDSEVKVDYDKAVIVLTRAKEQK